MSATSTPNNPRSLWPIAIAVYFTIAIAGIAVFITWAVRQNVDLVRKDYYAEEIRFENHLGQLQNTRELTGKTEIKFDAARDTVALSLPVPRDTPVIGRVQFYRPSDAVLDQSVKLAVNTSGSQEIDAHTLQNGLWKVRVTWSADGKGFFSEETIVIHRTRS